MAREDVEELLGNRRFIEVGLVFPDRLLQEPGVLEHRYLLAPCASELGAVVPQLP